MKKLTTIFLSCLFLFAGSVYAQKSKSTAPRFSSAYTNLEKACKTIKGGEGTDDASNCKGIDGYRIHVSASASAVAIAAETPDKKDLIPLVMQDLGFDETKIKIEWRTANGKPFAVIIRVAKYGETDDENPYIGKKIGEELIVRGLKGFEGIDFKVDTKTQNANVEARELADNAYLAKADKK